MMYTAQGEHGESTPLKRELMDLLGWARLREYLDAMDLDIKADAVGILRNLLHGGEADVRRVLDAFEGPRTLMEALDRLLAPAMPVAVVENALFALANICASSEEHRGLVAENDRIMSSVGENLVSCKQGGERSGEMWGSSASETIHADAMLRSILVTEPRCRECSAGCTLDLH